VATHLETARSARNNPADETAVACFDHPRSRVAPGDGALIELTVELERYLGFARARLPADRTGIGESRLPAHGSANAARWSGKIFLPAKP